jgi:hypothetical protein
MAELYGEFQEDDDLEVSTALAADTRFTLGRVSGRHISISTRFSQLIDPPNS